MGTPEGLKMPRSAKVALCGIGALAALALAHAYGGSSAREEQRENERKRGVDAYCHAVLWAQEAAGAQRPDMSKPFEFNARMGPEELGATIHRLMDRAYLDVPSSGNIASSMFLAGRSYESLQYAYAMGFSPKDKPANCRLYLSSVR
jgi:hypothetical protein